MKRHDPLQKVELAAAVLVVALGAFVTLYAYFVLRLGLIISPGAGFMPFLLGVALLLLGASWFLKTLLLSGAINTAAAYDLTGEVGLASGAAKGHSGKHLWGFLVILLFGLLLERAGFLVSITLFMLVWQLIVEKQKWFVSIVITVLTAGAMYVIFRMLLKIHLPSGAWFS